MVPPQEFQDTNAVVASGSGYPDPMVLIGCCPSSGSTLLSIILDAHPEVYCGPELLLFSHSRFWLEEGETWRQFLKLHLDSNIETEAKPSRYGEFWNIENGICPHVDLFHHDHFQQLGLTASDLKSMIEKSENAAQLIQQLYKSIVIPEEKRLWVEKSPSNIYSIPDFLEVLPEARAIIIVRDGRDVVCSLKTRGISFSRSAANWILETAMTLSLKSHPRVLIIRYEDLVLDTRCIIRQLVDFLNLPQAEAEMLSYWKNSKRAVDDPSIYSVPSWKSTPDGPISQSSLERWMSELEPVETYLLSKYKLGKNFSGAESMTGLGMNHFLEAFGYPLIEESQIDQTEVLDYLLREKSILEDTWVRITLKPPQVDPHTSISDARLFHHYFASITPDVIDSAFGLNLIEPTIQKIKETQYADYHQLFKEHNFLAGKVKDLENQLALTKIRKWKTNLWLTELINKIKA